MAEKTSSHRLGFTRDRLLKLGDAIPAARVMMKACACPLAAGRMVDSIYHNVAAGQFVVTISDYPAEVKV